MKEQNNLKIIPLGGLGEVGRNMLLLEYKKSIIVIDLGLGFPEENMPGIDYTVPNISYLIEEKNKKNILAIVFTHGHYDHIGALPYLIEKLDKTPIFASRLTKGIILRRQEDFPNLPKLQIKEIKDKERIQLGPFEIEFFRQNHNIADNLGLFIKTPVGNIIHTSDFKFDLNPVNDKPTDFKRLKELAERKILLLMSESTGAEEEGHSLSEKDIFENLEKIFKEAPGRIIAATFSSLINRMQQIITLSEKYQRKVAIDGYTMRMNVEICKKLGYLKPKKDTLILAKHIQNYPDSKITLLGTGAQGEGSAILMRIANKEYPFLRIKKSDAIIFSSSVVPGNERTVQYLKDELLRQGAKVFHYKMMDIHASGHAKKEELKKMLQIMNPKFFLPISGQYSMLVAHSEIAKEQKIPENNIVVVENGQVVNLNRNRIFVEKKKVPANYVMVDGLGVGDIGEVVLRDRKLLAQDGMFVIVVIVDRTTGRVRGSPDIISRGFVYLRESKTLLAETRKKVINIVNKTCGSEGAVNFTYVKSEIRSKISNFLYTKTQRRPMILPVVIEV